MRNVAFFTRVVRKAYSYLRSLLFLLLSDNRPRVDESVRLQPILTIGEGAIRLYKCNIGYPHSEAFWSGYCHIEARKPNSEIVISDNVFLNNGAALVAEGASIFIGPDCLIGPSVRIYDSDFHNVDPRERTAGTHQSKSVHVGRNVFIGAGVTILKGVTIGDDSVLAAGSVVTRSIPPRCIAAGNPASVIRKL